MAHSDAFGRLVTDIIGRDGLREASRKTKISAPYLGLMKSGHVASPEKITDLLAGYNVTGETAHRLWAAAREVEPDLDIERAVHAICDAVQMPATGRLHVLEVFRQELRSVATGNKTAKSAAA